MRTYFLSLLLTLAFALPVFSGNPILSGADPHAIINDREVWIYPTGGGQPMNFYAWSSTHLGKWKKHGPIFSLDGIPWIREDGARKHFAWAPCTLAVGGKFYFYYSVGPQNPTPSRIGAAISDNPAGPFVDSGKPLMTGGDGFEAIDPFVWKDPGSDRYLLYAGGSAGAKLRVFELGKDLVSIAKEIHVETPKKFTEGAYMHFWNGKYYLSYSHGNYRDDTYSIHYSIANSATGPWKYEGAILTSDRRHKGPGHHSLIYLPVKKQWLMVYHRWNDRRGSGPYNGGRVTCIDTLEHDDDGAICPVVMTDEGYGL